MSLAKVLLFYMMVLVVLWEQGVVVARESLRPIRCCMMACGRSGVTIEQRLEITVTIEGLAQAFNQMASNLQRSSGRLNSNG